MKDLIKKYLTIEEECIYNYLSSKDKKDYKIKVLITSLVYSLNECEKEINNLKEIEEAHQKENEELKYKIKNLVKCNKELYIHKSKIQELLKGE